MSPSSGLPPVVGQFAADYLESRDALYVLVTLMDEPDRWFTSATVAVRCHVHAPEARRVLDTLAAANLLDMRLAEDVAYRYEPGTSALRDAAARFRQAYRDTPALVLRAVSAGYRRSLTDFANAFRIRRDDDR